MPDWMVFGSVMLVLTGAVFFQTRSFNRRLSEGEFEEMGLSSVRFMASMVLGQGLLGVVVLAVFWVSDVPYSTLMLDVSLLWILAGVGTAIFLSFSEELIGFSFRSLDIGYSTQDLRNVLDISSWSDWLLLTFIVMPVVAFVEELLFRGVLVGTFSTGFGVSPWVLAIASSLVFGGMHDYQKIGGVFITGFLGFGLAAVYILSGSFFAAVVAHYTVNMLEFILYEGLGIDGWK